MPVSIALLLTAKLMLDWLKETEMATRLETAIAANRQSGSDRHRRRQSAHLRHGRQSVHVRRCESDCGLRHLISYEMSGRGDTDSPWRGRQKFHIGRRQSRRRLRQFLSQEN